MDAKVVSEELGVYKPCAYDAAGATAEFCTKTSGTLACAIGKCLSTHCGSPCRRCLACVEQGEEHPFKRLAWHDRLCQFHANNGQRARRPKKTPGVVERTPLAKPLQKPVVQAKTPVPPLPAKPSPAAIKPPAAKSSPEVSLPAVETTEPRWKAVMARVRKAIAEAELIKLPPERFRPLPGQPREYFDPDEMGALEESIREVGQIQDGMCRPVPLDGSGSDHELLDGERRWRCVVHAGIKEYRAKRVVIDDEAAPYVIAAISNFNRSDHTPMEKSNAIEKLHKGELHVPMKEVAKILGISLNLAYKLHTLQKLCQDVKDMLDPRLQKKREEALPLAAAYEIARLEDPILYEWQKDFARKVVTKQMTLPKLRMEVDRILAESGRPSNYGGRNEPARKWKFVEHRIGVMCQYMMEVRSRIEVINTEAPILPKAANLYAADLNNIIDNAEACLKLIGGERRTKPKDG